MLTYLFHYVAVIYILYIFVWVIENTKNPISCGCIKIPKLQTLKLWMVYVA